MNNIDKTKKIKFTIEVAEVLEFIDLKLTFDKEHKHISVDIFAKASFTYIIPSTCLHKSSTENVPKGVAYRFRRISDFVILMTSLKNAVSSIRNI